jgi:two-component system sensor histidine kinase/response regulator
MSGGNVSMTKRIVESTLVAGQMNEDVMTRILVIDDDDTYRRSVSNVLQQSGFDVLEATSGHAGVEIAQTQTPDLVICDVVMEHLDGFAVIDRLRMDPSTSEIPFMFMSGLSDKDTVRKGMNLGADDFLVKPFSFSDLLAAVEARLTKRKEIADDVERKLAQLRLSISLALPHELRTPLAGVLGFAEILADEANVLPANEVVRIGKMLHRSGERLGRVIENFMTYAQIEIVGTDPQKVATLRKARFLGSKALIGPISREKAEQYKRLPDLDLDLQDCAVAMSGEYVSKICSELLDNAFKFTDAGSKVEVKSEVNDSGFVMTIADKGRGMSRKQIEELGAYVQFERRYYEQQGTGLGLTIAKRLVEIHGGKMEFDTPSGEGLTIRVCLPTFQKG